MLRGLVAVWVLLTAGLAQAATLTLGLGGAGLALPTGRTTADGQFEVAVAAAPYTLVVDDLTEPGWLLDSSFWVAGGPGGLPGNSRGSGRFTGPAGGDAIDVVFDGLFEGLFDGELHYRLTYDVTGGAGRFAGADGSGFESVRIDDRFAFTGVGRLLLTVPEPATLALCGLAWAAAGGCTPRHRRQRRSGHLNTPGSNPRKGP